MIDKLKSLPMVTFPVVFLLGIVIGSSIGLPSLMNIIQVIFWIVLSISGAFAAYKVPIELNENLKWHKAEAAKKLNDEMLSNRRASQARKMLDYTNGRRYDLSEYAENELTNAEEKEKAESVKKNWINIEKVSCSLGKRDEELNNLTDEDLFIRDCFDRFFFSLGIFEHNIIEGLVDFKDVRYPVEYYVKKIISSPHADVFESYLIEYGFWRTSNFLKRFQTSVDSRSNN